MSIRKSGLALACVSLLLSGCASYQAANLNPLLSDIGIQKLQSSDTLPVTVAWKVFDQTDCKQYLDRDVIRKGYVPIQITVYNDSDHPLYINPEEFNVAIVPYRQVTSKAHTSTVGRVLAYGVPGLFLWPFLIPAVVDGLKSSEANEALDIDYTSKAIAETVIRPHSVFNGLIFVNKGYANSALEIPLTDRMTNDKLVFSGIGENKTGFALANSPV